MGEDAKYPQIYVTPKNQPKETNKSKENICLEYLYGPLYVVISGLH